MSGEMMTFPESQEEFIKQYSFTDKERVYTNGSELIPVFRVRQMLEHYTRKPMERILTRLEEKTNDIPIQYENNYEKGVTDGIDYAMQIVEEEGGTSD